MEGREVAPVSVGVAVAAHIIIQLGRSLTPTPVPVSENLSMPNRRRTTVHPDDSTALTRREFIERSAALAAGLAILDACGRPRIEPMSPGGPARFSSAGDELTLANDVLSVTWSASSGGPRIARLRSTPGAAQLRVDAPAFALTLADGTTVTLTSPPASSTSSTASSSYNLMQQAIQRAAQAISASATQSLSVSV